MKQIDNTPIENFNIDWGDPDGTGKKAKSLKQVQNFLKKKITGLGYTFLGIATPSTIPVTLNGDEKVCYIATSLGQYHPDFGTIKEIDELSIIRSDYGRWRIEGLGISLSLGNELSEVKSKQSSLENEISKQNTAISKFEKSVRTQVDSYKPIEINGNVNNAPDNEDLTTDGNNLLKIANRGTLHGKGYKILRRGVDLQTQFNQENTIYEIRYDFDLGGNTLNIPIGCTLKFDGGSIKNGTLIGDNTNIIAGIYDNIFSRVAFSGNFEVDKFSVCWNGANSSYSNTNNKIAFARKDCSSAINSIIGAFKTIYFPKGAYYLSSPIIINAATYIILEGNPDSGIDNSIGTSLKLRNAVVFTDQDIDLVTTEDGGKAMNITIQGGCFDVSLAGESYSSSVIHLKTNAAIWGVNLNTTIYGKTNIANNGIGIHLDGSVGEFSQYITYVKLESDIRYMNIATKIDGQEFGNKKSWITEIQERSSTIKCRQSFVASNTYGLFVEGKYQAGSFYETSNNDSAVVYLKTYDTFINFFAYDTNMKLGDKYTNRYALELQHTNNESSYHGKPYQFGNMMEYYLNTGQIKNVQEFIAGNFEYPNFHKTQYGGRGYAETDNCFIKSNKFDYNYESNCEVANIDSLFVNNSKNICTVKVAGVENPQLTITIQNKSVGPLLLLGFVMMENKNGYFSKITWELEKTSSNSTSVINFTASTTSNFKVFYFTGQEFVYSGWKSAKLIFSDYKGTENPQIYSIFGKARLEPSNFLTHAGGSVYGDLYCEDGGFYRNLFGRKMPLMPFSSYNKNMLPYNDENNKDMVTGQYMWMVDTKSNPNSRQYPGIPVFYQAEYNIWVDALGREVNGDYPVRTTGTTSQRPTSYRHTYDGFMYFDTDLNKPIWKVGTTWVDASGTEV